MWEPRQKQDHCIRSNNYNCHFFPPPQNRFFLEGSLEIHNGVQNARFGSSLAPVPDLNGDGFNDLVVGAPLEDEHKGAIYIFFSQQNRILRKYKQVGGVVHYTVAHTCKLSQSWAAVDLCIFHCGENL